MREKCFQIIAIMPSRSIGLILPEIVFETFLSLRKPKSVCIDQINVLKSIEVVTGIIEFQDVRLTIRPPFSF